MRENFNFEISEQEENIINKKTLFKCFAASGVFSALMVLCMIVL